MPDGHSRSLLTLYSAVFILSLTGYFSKVIPFNAVVITQIRCVVAAVFFAALFFILRRTMKLSSVKECIGVYILGILMGGHWITFFHSMQISTVAIGMLSLFCFPVITVLIEPIFKNDRLKGTDLLAALCVILGLFVMVFNELSTDLNQLTQSSMIVGVFWGVVSAILFSLRNTIQKYYFDSVPSSALMLHQVIAIGILLLPFSDLSGLASSNVKIWFYIVLLGILPTAIGHTLLSYSLKKLTAKSVAIISCMQPLIAALIAWYALEETPSIFVVLGGMIILLVAIFESVRQNSKKSFPK